MIGGNAEFERGKNKDLLVASDLEDGAVAVADVETLLAIEGNAGGYTHAFRIRRYTSVGSHAIHGAVVAGRHIHIPLAVEGDGGGVHHLGDERFDVIVSVNLEDRDRNFLTARARECGVNVALMIKCGAGYGVKILGDWHSNFDGVGIADVTVCRDHDRARCSAFGYAGNQKRIGADDDGCFEITKLYERTVKILGPQAGAADAE